MPPETNDCEPHTRLALRGQDPCETHDIVFRFARSLTNTIEELPSRRLAKVFLISSCLRLKSGTRMSSHCARPNNLDSSLSSELERHGALQAGLCFEDGPLRTSNIRPDTLVAARFPVIRCGSTVPSSTTGKVRTLRALATAEPKATLSDALDQSWTLSPRLPSVLGKFIPSELLAKRKVVK